MSNTADPVLREIRRQNTQIRALKFAVVILAVLVPLALTAAFWIRSNDLERLNDQTSTAAVEECFRTANQRGSLLTVALDPQLPKSARELALTLWENTPTIRDCRNLADSLHISVPKDLR